MQNSSNIREVLEAVGAYSGIHIVIEKSRGLSDIS